MMRLPGSAAFVTGAAQGLGKAYSESLLQRGVRVCLSDVQIDKGKEVESEMKKKYGKDNVVFIPCDVKSEDSFTGAFQKAISKFGAIDLMVNNAGILHEGKFKDVIAINLQGTVIGTALAIEHMRKDRGGKGGTIINVASTAGLTPAYFCPIYAGTKYGVVGFTSSWARNPHVKEMEIQFGCLCPAFTSTPIWEFFEEKFLHPDGVSKLFERIGINKVEDVAKGFLQLVEKENCNGDIVTVIANEGVKFHRRGRKSQL